MPVILLLKILEPLFLYALNRSHHILITMSCDTNFQTYEEYPLRRIQHRAEGVLLKKKR